MASPLQKTIVQLIGRTGDGKSSTGNLIVRKFGNMDNHFSEDRGAGSHTHEPKSETVGKYVIVDNPGLVDSEGREKDKENLIKIVNHAKLLTYASVFALIINSQSPRFDGSMQDAVKLIVDSFGAGSSFFVDYLFFIISESLNHFCLIYTRCPNVTQRKREVLGRHSGEVLSQINRRCNTNLRHLPAFFVDCHPEELAEDGVPEETIRSYKQGTDRQLDDFLLFSDAKSQFSTTNAVYGKYDSEKAEEEAKKAQREAKAEVDSIRVLMAQERAEHEAETRRMASQAEKERADRAFAAKVVSTRKQTQRVLVSSTTNPKLIDERVWFTLFVKEPELDSDVHSNLF
jgi:predicted phosphodiesterase